MDQCVIKSPLNKKVWPSECWVTQNCLHRGSSKGEGKGSPVLPDVTSTIKKALLMSQNKLQSYHQSQYTGQFSILTDHGTGVFGRTLSPFAQWLYARSHEADKKQQLVLCHHFEQSVCPHPPPPPPSPTRPSPDGLEVATGVSCPKASGQLCPLQVSLLIRDCVSGLKSVCVCASLAPCACVKEIYEPLHRHIALSITSRCVTHLKHFS